MGGSKLIESISKRLTNFFVRNGLIKEYDSEVYSYGFEMFVSEIISWLIIIPIAIISGEFLESMAFVFSFIIFRTFGGGYHANTHYGCIFSFTFIYLVGLTVGKFISMDFSYYLIGVCMAAAGILLWIFAPIDHKNKPFDENDFKRLRKKTRLLYLIYLAVVILLLSIFPSVKFVVKLCAFGSMGLFMVSMSVMIQFFVRKKEKVNSI